MLNFTDKVTVPGEQVNGKKRRAPAGKLQGDSFERTRSLFRGNGQVVSLSRLIRKKKGGSREPQEERNLNHWRVKKRDHQKEKEPRETSKENDWLSSRPHKEVKPREARQISSGERCSSSKTSFTERERLPQWDGGVWGGGMPEKNFQHGKQIYRSRTKSMKQKAGKPGFYQEDNPIFIANTEKSVNGNGEQTVICTKPVRAGGEGKTHYSEEEPVHGTTVSQGKSGDETETFR